MSSRDKLNPIRPYIQRYNISTNDTCAVGIYRFNEKKSQLFGEISSYLVGFTVNLQYIEEKYPPTRRIQGKNERKKDVETDPISKRP